MAESYIIRLSFEEGGHETVRVTPLDQNNYRLEATPFFQEEDQPMVYLGDVLEVEPRPDI